MKGKKVLIAGAGIAGPALAIALIEQGAGVSIIESRSKSQMEEGLFIGISPNGLNILRELTDITGLYDDYCPGALHFLNARGKCIASLGTAYQKEQYGIESVQVRRSAITRLLHERLASLGGTIQYDCRLEFIDVSGEKVAVRTSNGVLGDFDILIGADGIHSRCRNIAFPRSSKPVFTELLSTGAIVDIPGWHDTTEAINMTFGERAFFAYATSNKGGVWWFNNFYRKQEPDRRKIDPALQHEIKTELLKLHREDDRKITEIITATEDLFAYPIYDMPQLEKWYTRNICLIGDAAHAISPHTGQGASLALEDSAVLAKCLAKYGESEKAFSVFQALRQKRVEKVVAQARKIGKSKSKANPVATFFRDFFLKHFINLEKKKMDWIYAYKVEEVNI
ncbi:NAD(P)/FAD-dependent oxidoreductase [Chitinophaga sp.]|uniref:FAD-dependent oxidoreductase n=1 Tax=Chitinophaga sp. TaxID=1869181 RepID=UPI002BD88274|nr:NAD(P)/FAD-dependent oxidoreductase [Chitinophaga sp.]HWV69507.1 NAD(P)/FAD-dependent oxidoreductase [Chitinophaga sp.]